MKVTARQYIPLCALMLSIVLSVPCSCTRSVEDSETMYQVATLQSLMTGNYDGFVSSGELRGMGDIGLGTFSAVDGEMIVLDGKVWQARFDGSVCAAPDTLGVPFASVTHFDEDFKTAIDGTGSLSELTETLSGAIARSGQNLIYVARIDVDDCDRVLVRSELPQNKPYRPLAEALATDQREFSYEHVGGSIVAVYFPPFFAMQNTPGWHCHFISNDRKSGGHMLDISFTGEASARFDATPRFLMYMPEDEVFAQKDLDRDMSDEIRKVEEQGREEPGLEDFVLLSDVIPDAIQEIRYHTTYNFIGDRIPGYVEPIAVLTREAADSLKAVSDDLLKQGFRLKIFDAYRPQCAVDYFMAWAKDIRDDRMREYFYPELEKAVIVPQGYVAEKSSHTRGSTVDLTLFDMTQEREVDMGCTFDYFGRASHPDVRPGEKIGAYPPINEAQYSNRMILREAMLRHGFKPYDCEWWHFTLRDEPYPDTYFTFPLQTKLFAR